MDIASTPCQMGLPGPPSNDLHEKAYIVPIFLTFCQQERLFFFFRSDLHFLCASFLFFDLLLEERKVMIDMKRLTVYSSLCQQERSFFLFFPYARKYGASSAAAVAALEQEG